jgi:hypothetical protein
VPTRHFVRSTLLLTRSEAQGLLDRLRAIHSGSAGAFPKSLPGFLGHLEESIREICDQRDADRADARLREANERAAREAAAVRERLPEYVEQGHAPIDRVTRGSGGS